MVSRDKREGTNLTIIEAVETLSSIADLDIDKDVGIAQRHNLIIQDKKISYKTVHWLHRQDADKTVNLVKETFRVILNYLRNFYRKEYGYVTNQQAIEGIKTIMVLVGEAAKKLDKYSAVFNKANPGSSITDLKEYKRLQEFYLTRIARKIDEGVLGKWILALSKRAMVQNKELKLVGRKGMQTKHVFVDLESVKKDTEYELFFMRKEDGSRFFSPRLIRNIKLVADFGDIFGEARFTDPLAEIKFWQDRSLHSAAKNVLRSMGTVLDRYYHETVRFKDRELVGWLNKALMALLLASNSRNLLKDIPTKSCNDYFDDFLLFLREALRSDDYHKLITYPPKGKLGQCLLNTTNSLCRGLYVYMQGHQEFAQIVNNLLKDAHEANAKEKNNGVAPIDTMWGRLSDDYAAMFKLFKRHASGPLVKVLEILQEGGYHAFDPLNQHNLPNQLYAISTEEHKFLDLHLPSPTYQEIINKVMVTDEFKGFLRSCIKDNFIKKHLLINLQDRTSWKEHARCASLEELQYNDEFRDHLSVVTLAKDTEFYHQLAPYNTDNHADVFIQHFKEHLGDESSGYLFPDQIKKALNKDFIDGVIAAIHRIFFSSKNILLREHRMDFIEIFDTFLVLKLLELVKPDSFSFTCKDGVDVGCTANVLLLSFIRLLHKSGMTTYDWQHLNMILYGPAILVRERVVQPDRFNRMLSALKTIEYVHKEFGHAMFHKLINEAFGRYYKTDILDSVIVPCKTQEY